MPEMENDMTRLRRGRARRVVLGALLFLMIPLVALVFYPRLAASGPYLSSAHGNGTYGVMRTSLSAAGLPRGLCIHCHEQHGSIDGSEPTPAGGSPSKYTLFYPPFVSQSDGFCLKCHTDISSLQQGGLVNRSYSFRAGGWTSDTVNDTKEEFSFVSPGSYHHLGDVGSFINGRWNFTADSDPCGACHNSHMVQGDPANAGSSAKTSGTRGWPASRPSLHTAGTTSDNNTWGVWGDVATEKMNNYTTSYQAPYRFNSTTAYEPDGSSTVNGSNLADYVTLCVDCHTSANVIFSTPLGRNLKTIDWNTEKHGKGSADTTISMDNPYGSVIGKVTSCTDCHEPHGSPHQALIRNEVNGAVLGGAVNSVTCSSPSAPYTDTNNSMRYLCLRCHQTDAELDPTNCGTKTSSFYLVHHDALSGDPPYDPLAAACNTCHTGVQGAGSGCNTSWNPINCNCCHYHRSSVTNATNAPATRTTF